MMKKLFDRAVNIFSDTQVKKNIMEKSPVIDNREYIVDPSASRRLESWGVDQGFASKLVELGKNYSYMYPEKRAKNMFDGGIAFVSHEGWADQVLFHEYSNTDSNNPYGECAELAKRSIIRGNEQGIFNIQTRFGKLTPMLVGGYSPTHFNKNVARHYWVGLIPEQFAQDNCRTMVVFDPSYRVVTTMEQSGYSIDVTRGEHFLSVDPPVVEVDYHYKNIGSIIFQNNSFSATWKSNYMLDENSQYESVLGITHDYKYGVSLAVCKNMANKNRRHGVVVLSDEEGFIAYQAAYSNKIQSTIIVPKNGHVLESLSERTQLMIIDTLSISNEAIGKFNT